MEEVRKSVISRWSLVKKRIKKFITHHSSLITNKDGFTLVELAIVLVVIGLILGAVLKGQELINNAKIKRAYNLQREVSAAIYTYYDRYQRYPGDDPNAASRWSGTTSGNNDGLINDFTFACTANATSETCQAWRHMKNANLITGSTTSAEPPANPYGGTVGVGYGTVQGLTTHWIGLDNVPGDVCAMLDLQYDDGVYNTGSVRGSGDYGTIPNSIHDLYFRM